MLLIFLAVTFPTLFVMQNKLFINEEILIILSIIILLMSLITISKINFDKTQKINEYVFYNFFLTNLKSTKGLIIAESNSMLIHNLFAIADDIASGVNLENNAE